MKLGIFLVLVLSIVYASQYSAFAEEELDARFLPSKLIEGSEGSIQVFAKDGDVTIPKKVTGVTATSLDSSIVRVTDVIESESGLWSEIRIRAVSSGETTIFVAASDFSPLEIPITIYGNKLTQEQLLVKAIPTTFTTGTQIEGYVSVQLADEDGFPVIANKDTIISISSSDTSVAQLDDSELIIPKGEYFAISKFNVDKSGETRIFASSLGMETAKSETIIVNEEEEDLEIKVFVVPWKLNTAATSTGYIVAQLHDSAGSPILATRDINVDYRITNSNFTEPVNSSPTFNQYGEIKDVGFFQIKEGSYWGFVEFSALSGVEDIYDILVSTNNPLTVHSDEVEAVNLNLYDDKLIKFEAFPIFATGGNELVGVVYLEDIDGNPVVADKDIKVKINSEDEEFLRIESPIIEHGYSSTLVYGKVSHSIPNDIDVASFELHAVTEESTEILEVEISGTEKQLQSLIVEPLVSEILADTNFPIVAYLDEGGEAVKFSNDGEIFVSDSEYFSVNPKQIISGDQVELLEAKSNTEGIDFITFAIDNHEEEILLESLAAKAASVELSHSDTIFAGINDVFSIQLLDSQDLPVFASEDIEIKFVAKDSTLLELPENISINRGEYYTLFDVAPINSGTTELSALAEELPITTVEVKVTSLEPSISLDAPSLIQPDESFTGTLSVTHDEIPLKDINIAWNIEGGIITASDSITSETGEAIAIVIPTSERKITIDASTSGSWYIPTKISKTVNINSTSDSEFMAFGEESEEEQYGQIEIYGFDPVIIMVPVAIGVAGFMLKKKGMMKIKE